MKKSEEIMAQNQAEIYSTFNTIPYALINAEITDSAKTVLDELTDINKYYDIYKKGASFLTEGNNGDYVSADLRFKMASSLIKKEVRFLFAESPDIVIDCKGSADRNTEEAKRNITVLNDLVNTILKKNLFEDALLKAAKDCFVGKRVAAVVNFNETDGVTITFLPSTQFLYETRIGNSNMLEKLVCFMIVKESKALTEKRIFKKKYELINNEVYLTEEIYDGCGTLLEELTTERKLDIDFIPAVIITNDGLTGDTQGESEIEQLMDYESWLSKLNNGDIDSLRKNMNATKYLVDMESSSTKGLSTAPGALWDLGSDQNLDSPHPMVGILESSMNYSETLKKTLDRVKTIAYEEVDMPNITLESLQGSITSGKSLKAIYWSLIVRCKEKMKTWSPKLEQLIDIIIKGSMIYQNCITQYTNDIVQPVEYEINVTGNIPLPEDEQEEKNLDIMEVNAQVMSKKAYMKKWRGLTDDEAQEELEQIALERQILEEASFDLADDNVNNNVNNIDI